jgi:hypothetical protein
MAITIGIIALVVICIVLASSRGSARRWRGRSDSSGFHWFGGDGGSSSGSDCGSGGFDGGGGGGGDGGGGC